MEIVVAGLIGEEVDEDSYNSPVYLGGSGCYAALGSSLFFPTTLVGVASQRSFDRLRAVALKRRIDISNLEICPDPGFKYFTSYASDKHTLNSFKSEWGVNPLYDYRLKSACSAAFLAADDPNRQLRFVRSLPDATFGLGVNENFIPHFQAEYRSLIAASKFVALNKRELALMAPFDFCPAKVFVVTDGAGPVTILAEGHTFELEIPAASAIRSPSGCGDVLAGAFFSLWVSNNCDRGRLQECLELAIDASKMALTSTGVVELAEKMGAPFAQC